jgi:hypothetical protein
MSRLKCSHREGDGECNFPCAEYRDVGLLLVGKHRGKRHLNAVPLEWILDEALKSEAGRKKLLTWLDNKKGLL